MDHFAGFLKFLSTLKFLTTFALHFDFSVWGSAPTECRMIGKKWKKKLELMAPSGILDGHVDRGGVGDTPKNHRV